VANTATDGRIEIWDCWLFKVWPAFSGEQFAEINANNFGETNFQVASGSPAKRRCWDFILPTGRKWWMNTVSPDDRPDLGI